MKQNEVILEEIQGLREKISQNEVTVEDMLRNQLPSEICKRIAERFEINGAIAVTQDNVRDIFGCLINQADGPIQRILQGQQALMQRTESMIGSSAPPQTSSTTPGFATPRTAHDGIIHMWPLSSEFHRVPSGFRWPSDSAFAMWDLWFCGNPSLEVGPYRRIHALIDLRGKTCKTNRTKTLRVITALADIAIIAFSYLLKI